MCLSPMELQFLITTITSMVHRFSEVFVIAIFMAAMAGCSQPGSTAGAVKQLPVIWGNRAISHGMPGRSISITGAQQATSDFASVFVPIVTSFQTNSAGLSDGSIYSSPGPFGDTITTSISISGSDVVFTGVFSDGGANYKITLHDNNTFDFSETIFYKVDFSAQNQGVEDFFAVISMVGATVDSNGFYRGNENIWVYIHSDDPNVGIYAWKTAITAEVVSENGFFGMKTLKSTGNGLFANGGFYVPVAPIPQTPPDYNDPATLAIIAEAKTLVPSADFYLLAYNLNGTWQPWIIDDPVNVPGTWNKYVH
jgi:hypothetical protein